MTNPTNLTYDTRNFINLERYMIKESLQYSLQEGKLLNDNDNENLKDFKFIMIRLLNKDKKSLVYNYISYKSFFLETFLYFISTRSKVNGNLYKEPGNFLGIVDNSLLEPLLPDPKDPKDPLDPLGPLDFLEDPLTFSNLGHNLKYFANTSPDPYYINTTTSLINIINRLVLQVCINNMSLLVDIAIKKDYKNFIKEVLHPLANYDKLIKDVDFENPEPINIINTCYFIVNDLEIFIELIRDKGYNINAGPQPSRGRINSINSSLSILDMEYRKSLYNHNNYHVSTANLDSRFRLNKEKFSFNNIHMNINGVRWSSTLSTRYNTVKNKKDLLQVCYKEIDDILSQKNTKPLTVLQLEIENKLFQGQNWFDETFKPKSKIMYNKETYSFIVNNKTLINNIISNPDKFVGNTKTHGTEYIPWFEKILKELGSEKISSMLIQYFLYVVSNQSITIDDKVTPGIPSIMCYNNFGNKVVDRYFYSKYEKLINTDNNNNNNNNNNNKNNTDFMSFSSYIHNDTEHEIIAKDINFNARVGGYFIYALIECQLFKLHLDQKPDELLKQMEFIRLTDKSRDIMVVKEDYIVHHLPTKLPMVCPPKEYSFSIDTSKMQLGGYLLNDVKYAREIFIKKRGYGKPTILKDKNIIVDFINGISRTPYKINTDTLNFIYKYGIEKNIIINTDNIKIKNMIENPYKSNNKNLCKQSLSLISKINLETNILNIAELYSDISKIYFPVRMDNRTRVYCVTDYFDYQKNDLAKGLISFSEPGKWHKTDTDAIKYFKAFGANMFGHNLDKKSLNYRVDWIDDNVEEILNFENNNIVDKSENKACFISFCFEFKRFKEFYDNKESKVFYSYLPIQLDATCNGYQHLTLLTREKNLFDVLNLHKSTHDDDPEDFYTYVVNLVRNYMESKLDYLSRKTNLSEQEDYILNSYKRLLGISFDRSMVKKLIMTDSYNAGIPKLVSLILIYFEEIFEGRNKYYIFKGNFDVKLKRNDIVNFVIAIKTVISKQAPKISELSKYLDSIVSICTKLNFVVPWLLPSGAEIRESYEVEESTQIKALFFVNTRYTFKRYQIGVYDLRKQKRATMPNLIHSLDATTIAILYNSFKNIGPLYTVHDCFGVTANNVPKLILKLKLAYIQLYSSTGYLKDFDIFLKNSINNVFGDNVYKLGDEHIFITTKGITKKVVMPKIDNVLNNSYDVDTVKDSANIIV